MEPQTIEEIQTLRNAVAFGVENGKRSLTIDLGLLKQILDGKVPVGNNELPPEEVTTRLYAIKEERDHLLRLARLAKELYQSSRLQPLTKGDRAWIVGAAQLEAVRKALGQPYHEEELE